MGSPGASGSLPPDTSLAPLLLRAIWTMDGIAALIVALRLYTSGFVLRKITLADYLMVGALVFGITNTACVTIYSQFGMGRHIFYLTPVQITNTLKWQNISGPVGILSPTFGRVSCAVYILHLIGVDRMKRSILHFCIWSSIVVNVIYIVLIFAQCGIHITALWDANAPGAAKCWNRSVQVHYGFFQGSANTLIDLVLTTLPAVVVWNLKLPQSIKAGLSVLLGLSLFAAIASIVKTVKIESLAKSNDITYDIVPFIFWYTVENDVVIATASIPAIRPLFKTKKAASGTYSSHFGSAGNGQTSGGAGSANSRGDNAKAQGHVFGHKDRVEVITSSHGIMKQTADAPWDEEEGRVSRGESEIELTRMTD